LKLTITLLVACSSLVFCHRPDISANFVRMPNGDESELVSIDLQKRDGSEDIKVVAQLKFHLSENQVFVNGHPVRHNVVSQLRMRVTIIEIENGIQKASRLAPVTFRVLVLENDVNGQKEIIVEEEFIKVEQDEVMQVDIKQIVWNGGKRLPMTSISYEDSKIHKRPHIHDHHEFVEDPAFKPHLPNENGYAEYERHHGHHRHHHHHRHGKNHWRIVCWFRRLSIGGKIAVISAGVVTFLSLVLSMVICWRRHCHTQKTIHIAAPLDSSIVIDASDDKEKDLSKIPYEDGEFHMEVDQCIIDVDDKKKLVE